MDAVQAAYERGTPFHSAISVDAHFYVSATLLTLGVALTALFSISSGPKQILFAVPASISLGFGAIYTLAAAGVYV